MNNAISQLHLLIKFDMYKYVHNDYENENK